MCINSDFYGGILSFIGTLLGALIGGWIAFLTTKWQFKRTQDVAARQDSKERWTKIYRNMRELVIYLRVVAQHDKHIEYAVRLGGIEDNLKRWMELSADAYKKTKSAEDVIIDNLCGSDLNKFEKEKILNSILKRTKGQESHEQTSVRANRIEETIQNFVIERADRDIAEILGADREND